MGMVNRISRLLDSNVVIFSLAGVMFVTASLRIYLKYFNSGNSALSAVLMSIGGLGAVTYIVMLVCKVIVIRKSTGGKII